MGRLHSVVRKAGAFTLVEVVISTFILVLLLMLAVPSVTGVLADRRLRRSLDSFNTLVREAQQKSMTERRAYLLVWTDKEIDLRPEFMLTTDDPDPVTQIEISKVEKWSLTFTAALSKDPPPEWVFWPSGNCEPTEVTYVGRDGTWTASYSPLTARAEVISYAAR